MVYLEPDPFLNELTKLYEKNREKGSVWVTLKHSSLKQRKKKKPKAVTEEEPADSPEYHCLVRATDGKRKISTMLGAKDHVRFQMAYATVLKAHMDALKKKEKKDKKDKKSMVKPAP